MKNVIILHGTEETDQSFWLPYAKKELEKKGMLGQWMVILCSSGRALSY